MTRLHVPLKSIVSGRRQPRQVIVYTLKEEGYKVPSRLKLWYPGLGDLTGAEFGALMGDFLEENDLCGWTASRGPSRKDLVIEVYG